jgi:quinolinate synthase
VILGVSIEASKPMLKLLCFVGFLYGGDSQILSPQKVVLIPPESGCPMAE